MTSEPRTRQKDIVVARPQNTVLVQRLKKLMDEQDLKAARLSRAAGLGGTAVNDILTGKNKNPSVPAIQAIAKVLQSTLAYLAGETDVADIQPEQRGAFSMPVIGVAEAGAFRKALPFDQWGTEGHHAIDAARHRYYPRARHFALEVRGDSMNAAKEGAITDGMYALCVDMVDAGLAVETGRIYVVRRTLDGGQTWEMTIKRALVFKDRVELLPESTNPIHEKITVPRGFDAENEREISAIGLVYGAMREFV